MRIQTVELGRINPAPYNPRKDLRPGDPEYEKLKRSLAEFGCVEPLVWNQRTGNLVGGHQRLKVLRAQGITEVEVSVVDLALEREKALNIALNKITGDWDQARLAQLLDELTEVIVRRFIAFAGESAVAPEVAERYRRIPA
jgi:ParB-like chromosome segregation protein Spo0J